MGDLQEPNVALIEGKRWEKAEKATQNIISQFQATAVSEKRRKEVIDYVQKLVRGYLGCEIFPYGSVPLKTFLPDGDIDLTAVGSASLEEAVVNDIVSVLEREERNRTADFVVKDVQLIRAEVKLVKCIVQNIVVDISFNQIGGLCTLCFLEQVDRLIGQDHLFKRSIILIKAWCYYESRILGAHHGLIATYALETLVLYIFHIFHTGLDGPLAVLYKFLDYFSKFDWDNYCISLNGPVRISALPEIAAETPENGDDLLLGSDFLRYCSDMFSVPSKGLGTFTPKHFNIVDPLKENNNLGRSVSRGNFLRIRSAFAYGARKLGRILSEPRDNIADELHTFFSNTLDRHGSGQRPDLEDSIPRYTLSVSAPPFSIPETKSCQEENIISGLGMKFSRMETGQPRSSIEVVSVKMLEDGNSSEESGLLGNRFSGDAKDHSTSKISNSSGEENASPVGMPYHAPHLYFSNPKSSKNENLNMIQSENCENNSPANLEASNGEDVSDELNSWDLSGDYNSHLICLQYGRWCYEYAANVPAVSVPPGPPPLPSHFQSMSFWDPIQHSSHFKRNGFSHGNMNGVIRSSVSYSTNQMLIPVMAFGLEDMPKQRGTGTYFPSMNRPPNGYRPSAVKGRNHGQTRSPHNNGPAISLAEANTTEKSYLELPNSQFLVDQGGGPPKSSDVHLSNSPRRKLNPNANGFIPLPEAVTEHGPVGPSRDPLLQKGRQSRSASSVHQTASQGLPPVEIQSPKPVLGLWYNPRTI